MPGSQALSRFMAKLLRHEAPKRGLFVTEDGYVDVEDILEQPEASRFSIGDIKAVVSGDEAGRFMLRKLNGRTEVKATFRHTFQVTQEELPRDQRMGDMVRLSKSMAKLLRHDAMSKGIYVEEGGYVDVSDVLSQVGGYSEEDVERVVQNDKKGRFQIRTVAGRKQVKATQGHSFEISDPDLIPINHYTDVRCVLHGTRYANWVPIKSQGLSRRRRTYIHFAQGETGQKSGFPPGCDIAIEIDLQKALRDGIRFYKSSNDVVLSPGNASGVISSKYFKRAYRLGSGEKLE